MNHGRLELILDIGPIVRTQAEIFRALAHIRQPILTANVDIARRSDQALAMRAAGAPGGGSAREAPALPDTLHYGPG